MSTTCLLHNTRSCARARTIEHARQDNRIRIVYGYDWKSRSDNVALIYDEVMEVVTEVHKKHHFDITFDSLGGKDGSIFCDICRQIQSADIAMFDVSTHNPNVILELGIAIGTGRYIFILRSRHHKRPPTSLSDLSGILEYRFSRGSGRIKFKSDFRRSLKSKLNLVSKKNTDR